MPDNALLEAVERAEKGQIDADLGGGVIKQRVARKGQGKSQLADLVGKGQFSEVCENGEEVPQ
ncbi:type II toxin-antitoxin system RelE/ParE family toxin [Mycetohabitans endofungorum]|uniref:type II toxin-antitoxin system RelE/ParE family toxin n=1 Tax=Mycetohabitans endofungorum TaxID=417203 RepID=UPI0030D18524